MRRGCLHPCVEISEPNCQRHERPELRAAAVEGLQEGHSDRPVHWRRRFSALSSWIALMISQGSPNRSTGGYHFGIGYLNGPQHDLGTDVCSPTLQLL